MSRHEKCAVRAFFCLEVVVYMRYTNMGYRKGKWYAGYTCTTERAHTWNNTDREGIYTGESAWSGRDEGDICTAEISAD